MDMRAALSDAPAAGEPEVAAPEDGSAESLRALHEKLESAFSSPGDLPPHAYQTPFDSGNPTPSRCAIVDLDGRQRAAGKQPGTCASAREMHAEKICSVISGLAMEAERGANERDEKIASLALECCLITGWSCCIMFFSTASVWTRWRCGW